MPVRSHRINGAASLDSANLVVGTDNVAKTQDLAGSDSIIQFNENGATLDIASLTLSLSADVVNAMQGWGAGERTAWLNLTNGSLSYGTATFNPLLEGLGFTVTGINGGSIGITATPRRSMRWAVKTRKSPATRNLIPTGRLLWTAIWPSTSLAWMTRRKD